METPHDPIQEPVAVQCWAPPREAETQPQGDRFRPPTLPPAPPAAAGASGMPDDHRFRAEPRTIDCVPALLATLPSTLFRVSSTLKMMEVARQQRVRGSELAETLADLLASLREPIREPLEALLGLITPDTTGFGRTDFHEWRLELLRLMVRGARRTDLDAYFRLVVFQREDWVGPTAGVRQPANQYKYRTRDARSPGRAGMESAGHSMLRFLNDLLEEVDDPANYGSRDQFDTFIQQKVLAFIYAAHLATAAQPPAPADPPSGTPSDSVSHREGSRLPAPERTEAVCRMLFKDWD